jgi:hypothetical protein
MKLGKISAASVLFLSTALPALAASVPDSALRGDQASRIVLAQAAQRASGDGGAGVPQQASGDGGAGVPQQASGDGGAGVPQQASGDGGAGVPQQASGEGGAAVIQH